MWLALASVIGALVVSDLLKIVTSRGKWRPLSLGGMPSTHAALVTSLAAASWFETGFSLLFLACCVFGALVVRDAFGVRLEVSRHSEELNRMTKGSRFKVTGHTQWETAAGVVVGAVVAGVVYALA